MLELSRSCLAIGVCCSLHPSKIRVATSPRHLLMHHAIATSRENAGILDTLAFLISQLSTRLPHKTESDTIFKEFLPPFELDLESAVAVACTITVQYSFTAVQYGSCTILSMAWVSTCQRPYTIWPRALDPPFALPQSLHLNGPTHTLLRPIFPKCF